MELEAAWGDQVLDAVAFPVAWGILVAWGTAAAAQEMVVASDISCAEV